MQRSITAQDFWNRYKQELRKRNESELEAFRENPSWTAVIILAVRSICYQYGLVPRHGEIRLGKADVSGHAIVNGTDQRIIAFEHENNPNNRAWQQELDQLSAIDAHLKVLAGCFCPGEDHAKFKTVLQNTTDSRRNSISSHKGEWLFIFGPHDSWKTGLTIRGYVLDESLKVVQADEDEIDLSGPYRRRHA
jgi:hypothetical protein